jgi:hypothetical protein
VVILLNVRDVRLPSKPWMIVESNAEKVGQKLHHCISLVVKCAVQMYPGQKDSLWIQHCRHGYNQSPVSPRGLPLQE